MAQNSRARALKEPWQDPAAQPYIRIENVTKSFGGFVAVNDVSLSIYQGEFFALLGGSGCGKTTLLRMLAGFEQPTSGRIFIDGVDMAGIAPYNRPVNMMFQSYALFPHMTVEQNVAFGLKQDRLTKAEIRDRVEEMLDLVQLVPFRRRRPHQLSGGQRQRVALARCLAKKPKLLLLDEPLAALDKKLRERTQFELVNIQEQLGITFVVVTHDQEEAMTMSSRIAVMDSGYVAQLGTPGEIYEFPHSRYVAEFIGSVNMFEGVVTDAESGILSVDTGSRSLGILRVASTGGVALGTRVWVAVRPEKLSIELVDGSNGARAGNGAAPDGSRNTAAGIVRDIAYLGSTSNYMIDLDDGTTVRVTTPNLARRTEMPITWEDRVTIGWRPQAAVVVTE